MSACRISNHASPPHLRPVHIPNSSASAEHGGLCLQLGDSQTPVVNYAGQPTTVSGFLRTEFEYKHSFEWYCVLIVGAFIIFFRVGGAAAVKLINYQRR